MSALRIRIKQRREQLGLTQVELAELVKTTQMQIWRYESGKGAPSIDTLIELAAVLNTSADWLLGLSQEIDPPHSETDLNERERRLLDLYRSKKPETQDKLMDIARML